MGRAIHATKSIFARIMTAGISEARRRAQTRMAFNVKAAMRRVLMAYRRPLYAVPQILKGEDYETTDYFDLY